MLQCKITKNFVWSWFIVHWHCEDQPYWTDRSHLYTWWESLPLYVVGIFADAVNFFFLWLCIIIKQNLYQIVLMFFLCDFFLILVLALYYYCMKWNIVIKQNRTEHQNFWFQIFINGISKTKNRIFWNCFDLIQRQSFSCISWIGNATCWFVYTDIKTSVGFWLHIFKLKWKRVYNVHKW